MNRTFCKVYSRPLYYETFRRIFFTSKFPHLVTRSFSPRILLHSSVRHESNEQQPDSSIDLKLPVAPTLKDGKLETPVDWLPFKYEPQPEVNVFENSGDLVKELEYDPSWPKPNFEFSDELKTADEDIKYMLSLHTASKAEIKEVVKRKVLEKIQRHPNDFTSIEVDIALRTLTIRSLFQHARENRKERKGGRVFLHSAITRRNKWLKILYRMDTERFNWLVKELKVEYIPTQLGGHKERYHIKKELEQLNKEYCANLIKDKKRAYHEELKKQQADFLKEKEETLAWIEKEENEIACITKELENLCTDK